MWNLVPKIGVWGPDLKPEEKKALGLAENALAFRQASPLTRPARAAGVRVGDIIVGIDDRRLTMTMTQFNAYIRTTYNVGDSVTLRVIRDGERLGLPMVLGDTEGF